MEITDVRATPISVMPSRHRMHMLVEVETNQALTGIGEAVGWGVAGEIAPAMKQIIEKVYGKVLSGEDPRNYRSLYDKMIGCAWYTDAGIGKAALAGVDTALVDLTGKAFGVPACEVLGGCYRTRVRPYASHPVVTPKTLKEACKDAVEQIEKGFTGVKMTFTWFPDFGRNLKKDMNYVKEIRDAIGYDVDLAISESGPNRGVAQAIKMARQLENYDLLFWEDPLPRGDIEGLAELSAAVDIPIEAGEWVNNQVLKLMILRKAVDAVNPDQMQQGLSETKKIADLAYAMGIRTYPHNHGTLIGVAATVQLVASMPDGDLMEYRTDNPDPSMMELLAQPLKFENGYIEVPQKPGLGIELDRNVLEKITVVSGIVG